MSDVFPFSAIVGQDDMKLALRITAVDPSVGGVLVRGDRGTGKSTAVRALPGILPPLRVVADCLYGCDPDQPPASLCSACQTRAQRSALKSHQRAARVVDLPLGASEDRIVGALDLERALSVGEKRFEPGLLARANRGYLYVDEINLLEDHLVDLLLDVAATGENIVEREGLSVRHPARFVLVGSGNPEEGELRPQLLDRFGLAVDVTTPTDIPTRVEVIRRADAFRRDSTAFRAKYKRKDASVRRQINAARKRLASVETPDAAIESAATLCLSLGTDGLRGELTLIRAARALAALDGVEAIGDSQLKRIAPSALRHRLRRDPLDESASDARIERALQAHFS